MTKKAINGVTWNLFSRIVSNGGQLLIYFILARLLTPGDFGHIAILLVFIGIAYIFANAGLGAAIIQNDIYDKKQFDTIYFLSLFFGLFVCITLYLLAPFLASFYPSEFDLVFAIRITLPVVIFNSINSIQTSILQRNLNFKKLFFASTIPIFISGFISIALAFLGFGVYSLIANLLIGSLLGVIICFLFYMPIPNFTFDLKFAKQSFNYSYKILAAAILDEVNKSVFILTIGKFYNNTVLGNYNMGRQIPVFVSATINSTIASVLFPYYANAKNVLTDIDQIYRKVIRVLNFMIFPLISIVFLISNEFITFFFTTKWIESVYYLNMFSIILGVHHLHTKITYYINAIGHSEITLKYELIKKVIGVLVLLISLPFGVKAIVMGQLIVAFISIIIMFFPTKKYLDISFKEQMLDIFPLIFLNLIIYLIIHLLKINFEIGSFSLIFYPLIYLFTYLSLAYLLNMKSLIDVISLKKQFNFKLK